LIVVNPHSFEHIVVLDRDHVQEELTRRHAYMQRAAPLDSA
jgi:hypothetical protein